VDDVGHWGVETLLNSLLELGLQIAPCSLFSLLSVLLRVRPPLRVPLVPPTHIAMSVIFDACIGYEFFCGDVFRQLVGVSGASCVIFASDVCHKDVTISG